MQWFKREQRDQRDLWFWACVVLGAACLAIIYVGGAAFLGWGWAAVVSAGR